MTEEQTIIEQNNKKEWTVMVYMAGDNNLSIDMAYALNDIRNVVGDDNSQINLLAYFDGNCPDVPTLYCDFTDTKNPQYIPARTVSKRFVSERNDKRFGNRTAASIDGEENSAAIDSFRNFVNWCVEQVEYQEDGQKMIGRKSKNYAVIFSGHGFGFQSLTLMKDNSSDYYMTIRKLRFALESVCGEVLGQKLAILGFDSCVMSMLEVAFELKDVAKTLIASEGTIPNAGWTYEPILKEIAKQKVSTNEDIFDVSKNIVRSFLRTQERFAVGGVSVDLAAWNLRKVDQVVTAVNELGEILLKALQHNDLKHQLELVLLKCHYKVQSFMFEQNVDLIDFCKILLEESESFDDTVEISLALLDENGEKNYKFKETLLTLCRKVIRSVNSCILLNGFSGGRFQYSNGISIFFPWTYLVFLLSMNTYDNLRFVFFNKGVYWREFLLFYLSEISLRGRSTQISEAIQNIEGKTTENPATRTTENPKIRLVEDFAGIRVIENPKTRTTENPKTRVIEDSANRTTENPKTRVLDGSIPFLYDFKNVATPWFVAGFNVPPKDVQENEQKDESET